MFGRLEECRYSFICLLDFEIEFSVTLISNTKIKAKTIQLSNKCSRHYDGTRSLHVEKMLENICSYLHTASRLYMYQNDMHQFEEPLTRHIPKTKAGCFEMKEEILTINLPILLLQLEIAMIWRRY